MKVTAGPSSKNQYDHHKFPRVYNKVDPDTGGSRTLSRFYTYKTVAWYIEYDTDFNILSFIVLWYDNQKQIHKKQYDALLSYSSAWNKAEAEVDHQCSLIV